MRSRLGSKDWSNPQKCTGDLPTIKVEPSHNVIEIEDHSSSLKALNDWLQINPKRTAIVTIGMHRGHLDPVEATMPINIEDSKRVLQNAQSLLTFSRRHQIPMIHVLRELEACNMNPRVAAGMVLSNAVP